MNAITHRKLTRKELTAAVAAYARSRGFSASTVRACTSLRMAAAAEYRARYAEAASVPTHGRIWCRTYEAKS